MSKSKSQDRDAAAATAAVLQVKELIGHIRLMRQPAARRLIRKLEGVYAAASFGREDLDVLGYSNLYDGDLCKAIADFVGSMHGIEPKTHDEMEKTYAK